MAFSAQLHGQTAGRTMEQNQWLRHVITSLIPASSVLFLSVHHTACSMTVSCYLNHVIDHFSYLTQALQEIFKKLFCFIVLFFILFVALQKRWSQSSRWKCLGHSDSLQHNESIKATSDPKGRGDRGALSSSALPSVCLQLQAKQGPTSAPGDPRPQPSARHGTVSVKRLTEDITYFNPLCAHDIKQGWLDSRCLP